VAAERPRLLRRDLESVWAHEAVHGDNATCS
jgi:hypothetical protein